MADWFLPDYAQDLHIPDDELLAGINSDDGAGLMPSDAWRYDVWTQPSRTYDQGQFPPTLPETSPRNDQLGGQQWIAQPEPSYNRLAGATSLPLEDPFGFKGEHGPEAWMNGAMFEMQVDGRSDWPTAYRTTEMAAFVQAHDEDETRFSNGGFEMVPNNPRSEGATGRRRQISGPKRDILLREFERNPYPDAEVISRLAQETGVNKKQIKVWFSNRRSRHLPKSPGAQIHDFHDTTLRQHSQPPLHLTESNLDQMQQHFDPSTSQSPLATYIDTPLPEDPAQLAAIQKQVESLPRVDSQSSTASHRYKPYSRVNSTHSIGSSGGSCDSLQSYSRSSNRGARRGRRLYAEVQQAEDEEFIPNMSRSPAFFCTFCGKELRDRYQWKRHEETLHVPRSLWVCDLAPCIEQKGIDERTFMRKDQYVQHVGIGHGRMSEELLKDARRDALDIPSGHLALKCGFCGKFCAGWRSRVNHVLKHFQDGMKLTSWWLGRLMLEDFVPRAWELEKPAILGDTDTSREISVWSCREIQNLSAAFRPDLYEPETLRFCNYCGQSFSGTDWTGSLRHVVFEHGWRDCRQDIIFSQRKYHEHLITAHAASENHSITTTLCRNAFVVLDGYELVREAGVWDVRATSKEYSVG